jgi:DNA mismatch repair ATPase MutS
MALKVPVCYPEFGCNGQHHEASMLVDAGLALKDHNVPVGNDICFSQRRLVLITGPNQGGKTTFLRSVGLAQLMAQCGLFVTAKHYACPVFTGIFTHFPNGEDDTMRMGLLEVELKKLSRLVGALKPGALLLMNESFQTTTPGDAKQLAQMIVPALKESGIFVLFVTHLYGYAVDVYEQKEKDTLFLLAQRSREGNSTYCILEGQPFKTAYGQKLFQEVMSGTS